MKPGRKTTVNPEDRADLVARELPRLERFRSVVKRATTHGNLYEQLQAVPGLLGEQTRESFLRYIDATVVGKGPLLDYFVLQEILKRVEMSPGELFGLPTIENSSPNIGVPAGVLPKELADQLLNIYQSGVDQRNKSSRPPRTPRRGRVNPRTVIRNVAKFLEVATPICLGNDFENQRGDVFEKCFNGFSQKLGKTFGHLTERCHGLDRLLEAALAPEAVELRYSSTYNRLLLLAYQLFLLEALVEAGDSISALGVGRPPFEHRHLGKIGREDYLKCVRTYSSHLAQADLTTLFVEIEGLAPLGFQGFQLALQRDLLTLALGVEIVEPIVVVGDEFSRSLTPRLDVALTAKPPTVPNFMIIPRFPVHLVPPAHDEAPLRSANAQFFDLTEMRHTIVALLAQEPGRLGANRPAPVSESQVAGANAKVPKVRASGPGASTQGRPEGAATAPIPPQIFDTEPTRWSKPKDEARSEPQEVRTSLRHPKDDTGIAVAEQDGEEQQGHQGRTHQPKDYEQSGRDASLSAGRREPLDVPQVPLSHGEIGDSGVLDTRGDDSHPERPEPSADEEIWMTPPMSEERTEYLDPRPRVASYGSEPEGKTTFDPVDYPWLLARLDERAGVSAAHQGDSSTADGQGDSDPWDDPMYEKEGTTFDPAFMVPDVDGFSSLKPSLADSVGEDTAEDSHPTGVGRFSKTSEGKESLDGGDTSPGSPPMHSTFDEGDSDDDSVPR